MWKDKDPQGLQVTDIAPPPPHLVQACLKLNAVSMMAEICDPLASVFLF